MNDVLYLFLFFSLFLSTLVFFFFLNFPMMMIIWLSFVQNALLNVFCKEIVNLVTFLEMDRMLIAIIESGHHYYLNVFHGCFCLLFLLLKGFCGRKTFPISFCFIINFVQRCFYFLLSIWISFTFYFFVYLYIYYNDCKQIVVNDPKVLCSIIGGWSEQTHLMILDKIWRLACICSKIIRHTTYAFGLLQF